MISGIFIIFMLAAFVGIFVWAYAPSRRERFSEAAALPLIEDDVATRATAAVAEEQGP